MERCQKLQALSPQGYEQKSGYEKALHPVANSKPACPILSLVRLQAVVENCSGK